MSGHIFSGMNKLALVAADGIFYFFCSFCLT